jgi:hypothetical protein
MTAQHRSSPPPLPLRLRGARVWALPGGRSGLGQNGLARLRAIPGLAVGQQLVRPPANDNRPTLRWRLLRLAACLGVLSIGSALVVLLDG